MLRAPGLIFVAMALLVGCNPFGLSRDEAVRLALKGHDKAQVTQVDQGTLGTFVGDRTLPELSRDMRVWAVVLAGEFPGECVLGPHGVPTCDDMPTSALVIIEDKKDGKVILAEYPAPARPH